MDRLPIAVPVLSSWELEEDMGQFTFQPANTDTETVAIVLRGVGDGKPVLSRLRPQLAYVQGCRLVADLHNLYNDEEGSEK